VRQPQLPLCMPRRCLNIRARRGEAERWRPRRLVWRRPAPPLSCHRRTADLGIALDRQPAAAGRHRASQRDAGVPPAAGYRTPKRGWPPLTACLVAAAEWSSR